VPVEKPRPWQRALLNQPEHRNPAPVAPDSLGPTLSAI